MKHHLIAGLLLSLAASTAAFADGGIGRAGTYNDYTWANSNATQAPKTREEVRAELAQAYRDGSLPALSRNVYPNKSLIASTQAERIAAQERNADNATRVARGE
ncbi:MULTISPECIES: DUF4148 domain-containing protein [Paraburkholderia]|uniref:DUF4148 domain-containing protein n=1 Tax=Paraburkholderia TaxID=1822464 RepID=UPI002250F30E|nr:MULTISPECIES: DUF4148 domain-containing protein [Paraburkholderia]MCX4162388.1 DUF4148 domain-containing protein [Paraburkholderia megapolitana]MDN7157883.1 DUF4148 domain-containing protein [Paraburkholderia sp. CHISQ3]MDQ6494930.1 DUF4148 domain-containing protein [Paraburkholderia megapolitana]